MSRAASGVSRYRFGADSDRIDALVLGVGAGVVAVALAGLTLLGVGALAAGVFAVQVALALSWLAVFDITGSGGVFVITLVSAGVMNGLLGTETTPDVGRAAGTLGVTVVVGLLFQLARKPRVHVATSFAATVAASTFALSVASYVALWIETGGDKAVAAALLGVGAALVVGRLVDNVLPRPAAAPGSRRGVGGVLAALGVAALVGWGYGGHEQTLGSGHGLRLALMTALLAVVADLAVDAVLSDVPRAPRSRSALPALGVLLPVVVSAPAAYVTGRILLG